MPLSLFREVGASFYTTQTGRLIRNAHFVMKNDGAGKRMGHVRRIHALAQTEEPIAHFFVKEELCAIFVVATESPWHPIRDARGF